MPDQGEGGVSIARTALDATRGRSPLSALLHARVALGHGTAGEKTLCGRALLRAEREMSARSTSTPWLSFVGPAEILAQGALCHDRLGDHDRSMTLRRQAVSLRHTAFQRNRFSDQVHFAECVLSVGAAEEAIDAGRQALVLLPGVSTPRWTVRLRAFRDNVLLKGTPGATEFADHYREATA